MLSARGRRRGFTLVELVATMSIVAILAAFAAPSLATSSSASSSIAAEAGRESIATAYGGVVARSAASNPAAPGPTLDALAAATPGGHPMALDFSGVCAGSGEKAPTFKDSAMSVPTSSASDVAWALGPGLVADLSNCP